MFNKIKDFFRWINDKIDEINEQERKRLEWEEAVYDYWWGIDLMMKEEFDDDD